MKSKKESTKSKIINCIKNKVDSNPYIDMGDITSNLFLEKRIGGNPSNKVMRKKYRAKKHQAKKLVGELLNAKKIKIDDSFLGSFSCL